MLRSTLVLLALPLTIAAADRFEFKDGDRVVLIGSTLIEREQRYGYWEAALTARNPDKNITFRNLGWSGDTVWGEARAGFGTIADGYKQLVDHVIAEKPTVIIVGYGTNESFAGPEGLPKFKKQLKKLLDDLSATKARFVLLSPMKMFKMPPPLPDPTKANENLKLYGEAIEQEANQRASKFIDLSKVFEISVLNENDPITLITDNGMHLVTYGYVLTGSYLSGQFGGESSLVSIAVDAEKKTVQAKVGGKVIFDGDFRRFRVTARTVPIPFSVVSGEEAGGPFMVTKGADIDNFQLKIDGQPAKMLRSPKWGKLAVVGSGPDLEQGELLRQTIIAKNKLYFYRWRPQNVTYLFGFRKHEQGNNAIEIPKFDPLIEAKEKEIAKLRVPREHVYELVPVKEKK